MNFYEHYIQRATEVEMLLDSEQLEYLRERFTVDEFPSVDELKEIASQWNHPDPDFYVELHDWFSGQHMAEILRLDFEHSLKFVAG